MLFRIGGQINRLLNRLFGLRVSSGTNRRLVGIEDDAWDVIAMARGRTMGSAVQQYTMWQSVEHVENNAISGDIIEFGVWRGGMAMIAAEALGRRCSPRNLVLFDTFSGMTKPDEHDSELYSMQPANMLLNRESNKVGKWTTWANASLEDVQFGLSKCCIPKEQVKFVVGDVHNTVPSNLSESISVCRIDTDWYSSTRHILENCWDRISPGGILILDDYDIWSGARKAVDEFFLSIEYKPFLIRTEIGRVVVK
jgi:O-methyltransferase